MGVINNKTKKKKHGDICMFLTTRLHCRKYRKCIMFVIIYFAMKSRIGDRVNTETNDILRQLKITSTGIVKFLTGIQRNMLV